jgi:hypothetical protein
LSDGRSRYESSIHKCSQVAWISGKEEIASVHF